MMTNTNETFGHTPVEKEKYILSSNNEMMPFKSFTIYQYHLIQFVMKKK